MRRSTLAAIAIAMLAVYNHGVVAQEGEEETVQIGQDDIEETTFVPDEQPSEEMMAVSNFQILNNQRHTTSSGRAAYEKKNIRSLINAWQRCRIWSDNERLTGAKARKRKTKKRYQKKMCSFFFSIYTWWHAMISL
jgi:hypothetical protein